MVVFMCVAETGQWCKPSSICNSGNSFTCLLLILSVDLSASMSWGNRGLQADRQAAALYKIKLLCIGRDYEFSYKWGVNALGFAPGVHSSELAISSMA